MPRVNYSEESQQEIKEEEDTAGKMYQLPSPSSHRGQGAATSQTRKRLLQHSYYIERRRAAVNASRGSRRIG